MWLLFLILMCGIANAEVYVITAPDNSVYSLSEQDDALVPNGYKKSVIKKKNISDLGLSNYETMYDYVGNKFRLNAKKVSDNDKAEKDAIIKKEKKAADKASLILKLKNIGLTDDEIAILIDG